MKLHVLLGSGGVGKTTLAASFALALAADGRRVGLLGIDPSRRLQDLLGLALADAEAPVPGAGALHAAIVQPHQAIERWVAEACTPGEREVLARNPFFAALGDRLATATDVLAAVRLAEWIERDPWLDDLVVDTAPGVSALGFLRSPQQIETLARGRMIRWLLDRRVRGARRVLGALAGIAGAQLVTDFADFFALVRAPLGFMLERVERARRYLAGADLFVVTSPRDTDAAGARQVVRALAAEQLAPHAVIVNRRYPRELAEQLATLPETPLVAYARACLAAQVKVVAAVAGWAPVIALPSLPLASRPALVALGRELAAFEPMPYRRAS